MYGKHFASMYTGSMYGAGAMAFAVMGYVIANMRPDKEVGAQVEINPKMLADTLGENEADVAKAIKFLCGSDDDSRSKSDDGRRLVKIGQFDYQVVNGAKYQAIKDEEARREYNRLKKREERAKQKLKNGKPLPGEAAYLAAVERGDPDADKMLSNQPPLKRS